MTRCVRSSAWIHRPCAAGGSGDPIGGAGFRVSKGRAFGQDLAEDGETLLENPNEQATIEWMRLLRSQGRSFRAIADALNTKGISPKQGGKWIHTNVISVLMRTT